MGFTIQFIGDTEMSDGEGQSGNPSPVDFHLNFCFGNQGFIAKDPFWQLLG